MFELKLNPKSLRDYLTYLRKSGLVKRNRISGFELTEAALGFLEIDLKTMLSTAKRAAQIASAEN
jgi:hypothetical protein